jgi:hypothetical protein
MTEADSLSGNIFRNATLIIAKNVDCRIRGKTFAIRRYDHKAVRLRG